VIIDGGSCVNIIVETAIEKMGLKAKPHPQPYNVTWVDKTVQAITQLCQVPIHMSSYHDQVWYDILDMDVAHILLVRLWLYDLDVISFGRSNTHEFKINEKRWC